MIEEKNTINQRKIGVKIDKISDYLINIYVHVIREAREFWQEKPYEVKDIMIMS